LENGNFTLKIEIPDIELAADEKGLTIASRNLFKSFNGFTAARIFRGPASGWHW